MKILTIVVYIILFFYLGYLSYKDIKKHELQYIETGLLVPVSLICLFCNVMNTPYKVQTILSSVAGVIIMFVFMLAFALVKKNGVNAFGGADIWVVTILAIVLGLTNSLIAMIITCLSFILYVVAMKLSKKEKKLKIAFVPFISIGTIIVILGNTLFLK